MKKVTLAIPPSYAGKLEEIHAFVRKEYPFLEVESALDGTRRHIRAISLEAPEGTFGEINGDKQAAVHAMLYGIQTSISNFEKTLERS